ncbi:MAG: hypothetical protein V4582_11680 [Pseudomonadota bacterium]
MKNLLAALVILAFMATNASACSCGLVSLDLNVGEADDIFIATLQGAKVMPGDYPQKRPFIEGVFRIKKALKGSIQTKEISLTTGLGRGDCGVSMFVSSTYIIFKAKEYSSIGICSGSSSIEDFQEDEIVAKIQTIINRRKSKPQGK